MVNNKYRVWYIGYIIALLLVLVILFTDFPKMVDIGLLILFSAIFSIAHTQILHDKMVKKDADYKINVQDERNIVIKEKAGYVTNMVNDTLLGFATILFVSLDYLLPAVVTGIMVAIQPIVLIITSSLLEKKM